MAGFSLRLLGPFRAESNGEALPLPDARRIPTLLALLALSGGELDKRTLAARLWPENDEAHGGDSLRHLVRKTGAWLGPEAGRLTTPRYGHLKLDLTDASVDLLAFDAAATRWRKTGDRKAAEEALALYGGPFLQGDGLEWTAGERTERERVRDDLLAATAELPPARAPATAPVFLTTFVGRTAEREGARTELRRAGTRLLTLWGTGGAGKTRLAMEIVAEEETPCDFLDLTMLPAHAPADAIYRLLADTLGKPTDSGGTPEHWIVQRLRGEGRLLLLDNAEHVVESAGQAAVHLLSACPTLRILATSRRPLGIPGEVLWNVPSLPDDEAEALFRERARVNAPKLVLSPDTVQTLCRRLDGLPLAIELAAAHLRWLTPEQLDERLARRFALLAGGVSSSPARHRALEATLQGSWELLDEAERELLARLSVFTGSFRLEDAEAICQTDLTTLHRLVAHSLVLPGERFALLESVREFAATHRPEAEEAALRRRFYERYREVFVGREHDLWRDGQAEAMSFFLSEREHLRQALNDETARGEGPLIYTLLQFWDRRNELSEMRDALEAAIPQSGDGERARGLRGWKAHLFQREGRPEEALPLLESLERDCAASGATNQLISTLNGLGNTYLALHRWAEAKERFARMRALCKTNSEGSGWLPHALQGLATALQSQGRLDDALAIHEEALATARENRSELLEATSLLRIARVRRLQGRSEDAHALLDEISALARCIDDPNLEREIEEERAASSSVSLTRSAPACRSSRRA